MQNLFFPSAASKSLAVKTQNHTEHFSLAAKKLECKKKKKQKQQKDKKLQNNCISLHNNAKAKNLFISSQDVSVDCFITARIKLHHKRIRDLCKAM